MKVIFLCLTTFWILGRFLGKKGAHIFYVPNVA